MSNLSIPKCLFASLLVLLYLASSARAESDESSLFARLDSDGDGQLTESEISDEHAVLFRRLVRTSDSNADGQLSSAEFHRSITPKTPEKQFTKKSGSELPGSDALLLLLAWMDTNSDETIEADEVPADLRSVFNQIVQQLKLKDSSKIRIRDLQQQAPRLTQMALRYADRNKLDVELELALLSNKQYVLVEQLRARREVAKTLGEP